MHHARQTIDNTPDQNPRAAPVYVTIPHASRLLGISARRLRLAVRDGKFPIYDVGTAWPRVKVSEVQRWIESTRAPLTDHAAKRVYEIKTRESRGDV